MTNERRVSVITPCLNPGWRLERCLASVAAQRGPEVEHIVVDGGSTDGTLDLLAHSNVTWVSEPDEGQTDAIAKGFGMATGDVLTWLGADDALRPDAIERSMAALATRPDAGWTYGDVAVEDPARRRLWRAPDTVSVLGLAVDVPIAQPGALIRRSALDAIGGLDPSLHFAMDIDLWLRLLCGGHHGVHVKAVVADFEVHPASKGGSAGYARFLLEAATVRNRHGLHGAAAATAGRAAAHLAREQGGTTLALDASVDSVLADLGLGGRDVARASAVAEAALLAWPSLRSARLLATPAVWRDRWARELLSIAARTTIRRVLRQDVLPE